ncbi:hypothetical protein [Actinopolyspora mortivallis]|uniref:hypothetical protein n=1 Tax=Actinopolyspora mortivallis TaxID=33906 RepID=UPI0012ED6DDF|nr:hypothetical protein [Actinopolyspora mortivallis]
MSGMLRKITTGAAGTALATGLLLAGAGGASAEADTQNTARSGDYGVSSYGYGHHHHDCWWYGDGYYGGGYYGDFDGINVGIL